MGSGGTRCPNLSTRIPPKRVREPREKPGRFSQQTTRGDGRGGPGVAAVGPRTEIFGPDLTWGGGQIGGFASHRVVYSRSEFECPVRNLADSHSKRPGVMDGGALEWRQSAPGPRYSTLTSPGGGSNRRFCVTSSCIQPKRVRVPREKPGRFSQQTTRGDGRGGPGVVAVGPRTEIFVLDLGM